MPRLRTVSPNSPGWKRQRAGRGFVYRDQSGERLPVEAVARIKALVIPPAWQDVWICPHPKGHIQAVGTDAAGRRQYLYHPQWRALRDEAKFDRVLAMARVLPAARLRVLTDLKEEDMTRSRVLATAVRLIDVGYFRIGSDVYADEHGSYGLTTLERRHLRCRSDVLHFSFVGKSGIQHEIEVDDPDICDTVRSLRIRRGGDDRLLAYQDGRRWRPVGAADVNEYLHGVFDAEVSAKDFRTWHATVIAATALADAPEVSATATARKRAVRRAVVEVAEYLGNTPAIAKGSYIHPRVFDLYEDGTTIAHAVQRAPKESRPRQERLERAVLRMLSRPATASLRSPRGATG